MGIKSAIVEVTLEYRVVMDEHGDIVDAMPMRSAYWAAQEAIKMADGVEFEEEV